MGVVRNIRTAIYNMKDDIYDLKDSTSQRHMIGMDAVSILDTDAVVNNVESNAEKSLNFQMMIKNVRGVLNKFVVVMLEFGYQSNEIAWMLGVHPSTITRIEKKIIKQIKCDKSIFNELPDFTGVQFDDNDDEE